MKRILFTLLTLIYPISVFFSIWQAPVFSFFSDKTEALYQLFIPNQNGIKKISSGNYHTLALTNGGKVYAWGFNYYGQVGGTDSYKDSPTLMEGLTNIIDISAGTGCSFALTKDGAVYAWGRNDQGQLADGTLTAKNAPKLIAFPNNEKIIQISCRFSTAMALTENGEVYIWGSGDYGALGDGKTADSLNPINMGLSGIVRVETGYYNGSAIDKDGRLLTWGMNQHGQLGNEEMSYNLNASLPAIVPFFEQAGMKIVDVSVGWHHCTAITENGELYTWGYGAEGRLGNNLTADVKSPQKIALSNKAVKAVAAYFHSAVMLENGEVLFFGQNAYGKHGNGGTSNSYIPVPTLPLNPATDFSLAYDSSFILVEGKDVYGMGYGGTGVLGNGQSLNSTSPVKWNFSI